MTCVTMADRQTIASDKQIASDKLCHKSPLSFGVTPRCIVCMATGLQGSKHTSHKACRRTAHATPRAFFQGVAGLLSRRNGPSKDTQSVCDPELQRWLTAKGLPQQRVALADIPGAGRGLVAKQRIKEGDRLLNVPSSLVLTAEKALAEMRTCGTLAGGAEEWGPYASILPKTPGTVLEWSDTEVEHLLAGSGLLHKAHEIRRAADKTWEELCPLVQEAQQTGIPGADMLSRQHIHWALGVLLSRCIRLDSLGGIEAVVPWADSVNHSVDANCFCDWDEGLRAVTVQVDRAYAVGDEVVVSYGAKSSGELLLSYGFCPATNTNPNDAAYLLVGLDPTDSLLDLKTQLLGSYRLPASDLWPLRMDGLPAGLLQYVVFCDAAPSVAAETVELARWLFADGYFPVLDGCSTEALALEGLARRCNRALKGYPTSMQSDKATAAAAASDGSLQREAVCASIRVKERQILARTEFVLRGQLRKLAG